MFTERKDMIFMTNVGANIKKYREKRGMTMDALAEKVGVTRSAVAKWESEDIKNVSRSSIEKIAEALRVTPCHLLGWDNVSDEDDNIAFYSSKLKELSPRDRNAVFSLIDYFLRS